jgi:hypothetical protein
MPLFEKGGATGAEAVNDCLGTAPVSGPSTLAATADGFGLTLPIMKGTLHLIHINMNNNNFTEGIYPLFTLVEID